MPRDYTENYPWDPSRARPRVPDGYAQMIQGLIDSYRRAPWDWEEVRPGPGDIWCEDGDREWVRHKTSGVIIVRPSEGESMESIVGVPVVREPLVPNYGPNAGKQPYYSGVRLGERYREKQTGFEGHAVAIYFYQNSCERVELENYSKKRGLETLIFDAKRLEHLTSGEIVDSPDPGGPKRTDPRRSTPTR